MLLFMVLVKNFKIIIAYVEKDTWLFIDILSRKIAKLFHYHLIFDYGLFFFFHSKVSSF